MPASEETWRRQHALNVVFALSSLAMLATTLWMLADDHLREWKGYVRTFMKLERQQLQQQKETEQKRINQTELERLQAEIADEQQKVDASSGQMSELESQIVRLKGAEQGAKQALDFEKANLQKARSDEDIARRDGHSEADVQRLGEVVEQVAAKVEERQVTWETAKAELDAAQSDLATITAARDATQVELDALQSELTQVEEALANVGLGRGRGLLTLPLLDAFNSPLKVQTIWLPEMRQKVGSFGEASRFDRCTTCHIPIDRSAPGTATVPGWPKKKSAADAAGYDHPFVSHPRLELYVGSASPHPQLEFGCTICHQGQGSDTSFVFASHTPNTLGQEHRWVDEHGWYENHHWDTPQWPARFIQSGCLQCHHTVVELGQHQKYGASAPKVAEGFELVRTYGCYGCHEIIGYEDGVSVGPDLRIEPATPEILARSTTEIETLLDKAPAPVPAGIAALVEATKDPNVIPGKLRKVGPSLVRLAEKTTPEWTARWVKKPGAFRPKTRMPHFYGLYNNSDAVSVKKADTEIQAMVHYLFRESRAYLGKVEAARAADGNALQQRAGELRDRLNTIKAAATEDGKQAVLTELAEVEQSVSLRQVTLLGDPAVAGDASRGKTHFLQKGCLACHSHRAFSTEEYPLADAEFGPDLSDLAAKLIPGEDGTPGAEARKWLYHWLLNPRIHHPRGYMPDLQIEAQEAADLAEWLLSQPGEWAEDVAVAGEIDEAVLDELVLLYLRKAVPLIDARDYLAGNKGIPDGKSGLRADEMELVGTLDTGKKLAYLGRKTISRLGCFGCHDTPGFETAKPIGTGLADWGKKDPDLLAFERVGDYLESKGGEHADDADTAFYHAAIKNHKRHGFIWQKLHEPRSFDYGKLELAIKPYEDRLRMPRFRFAPTDAENDAQIEKIVTFVLGLRADPPAEKFVYRPTGPERRRIEGLELLTRYNCVGCHMLEMPKITFKVDPDFHESVPNRADDYAFHAARVRQEVLDASKESGIATIEGLVTAETEDDEVEGAMLLSADLWQPAAVMGNAWRVGEQIVIRDKNIVSRAPAFGGQFAQLLVDALVKIENRSDFGPTAAWPRVPPPLVREGEKVQTAWLYQFLINPIKLRPMTVLRMPLFNLRHDEARTLAEYFAAADGVAPYETLDETSPSYLADRDTVHQAVDPGSSGYLGDAYQLLANRNLCLQCHKVGASIPGGDPAEAHGPELTFAPQRFRSNWLLRWIGNPDRVLPYTGMPQNFPNGSMEFQEAFSGPGLEQVIAVRDVLLNYNKVIADRLASDEQSVRATAPAGGQ